MKALNTARQRPPHRFRSLPIQEWSSADQRAWAEACRPGVRLKPGGRASYLAEVSRKDFANRYGAFLGFLRRSGKLKLESPAAAQVTASSVQAYAAELKARVSSVTTWNCIYKLRRAAQLLNPRIDFSWLAQIESELALVMVSKSKFDRLVLTGRIVEAGLTLIVEADKYAKSSFERVKGIRNGLMIAILALCQIRLKNFVALEIGSTFKEVNGSWWISLPSSSTKNKRWDERRIPNSLNRAVGLYLNEARPVLTGPVASDNSLWISSRTGRGFTYKNLGTLISKITYRSLGVDVSPQPSKKWCTSASLLAQHWFQ